MKLSTKLKISFGILILVPAFLFTAALTVLLKFQINEISNRYHTSDATYDMLANPAMLFSKICESEYVKLIDAAETAPEQFSDTEFLDSINKELSGRYAYLIVVDKGVCTYSGESGTDEIVKELTRIDFGDDSTAGIYLGGNYQMIVNRVEFVNKDKTTGNAFIIMKLKEYISQVRVMAFNAIIVIVLVLVFTSGLFIAWIHRETLTPINKLRLATNNIKNGNLDFDIDTTGQDEFSDLYRDFNSMRLRLKQNAEEKLQADAESKELISNISHDLKTPITAIKGYVEGIIDGVADTDEKMDHYIKTIYNKACDMDKLIDELTFYSKIDTNKIPYNFTRLPVSEYFSDCGADLEMELGALGIRFSIQDYVKADTDIVADPEQLKRVINNIISNSVKYMEREDGAEITIVLKEDGDYVNIDIRDNGKGIDPIDLPHIFNRFYRSDTSRNSTKGGSGIGLSIVKKIISDHGGEITADSRPDEGTVMHIKLKKYMEQPKECKRITDGKRS